MQKQISLLRSLRIIRIRWPGLMPLIGTIAIFLAGLILGMEIGYYHRSLSAFIDAVESRCQQ